MADEINKAPLRVVAGGGEINHADSAANSPQTENRRRIHLAAHATAVAPNTSVSHGNNKSNRSPKGRPNGWRARLAALFPTLPPVKRSGERSIFFYMFKCLFLRYFSIKGRASRKEFWGFVLLTVMAEMLVFYLFFMQSEDYLRLVYWLNVISIVTLAPTVAVIIRRVHDFGKSGWWLFVPTPRIILFGFVKGDEGENKFGAPE